MGRQKRQGFYLNSGDWVENCDGPPIPQRQWVALITATSQTAAWYWKKKPEDMFAKNIGRRIVSQCWICSPETATSAATKFCHVLRGTATGLSVFAFLASFRSAKALDPVFESGIGGRE
ncbi:hypothetical protein FQR65_LT20141 [Abscondita terminalis]|nr:hypothetical protein FQR65_LT20141 [Abscondita terminalis]